MLDSPQARPTRAADGTDITTRAARQANLRSQVHQRLVELGSSAARQMAAGPTDQTGFPFLGPGVDLEIGQAGQDPPQVSIKRNLVLVESERSDSRRGVRADPRKPSQTLGRTRKFPPMFFGDDLRRLPKLQGSAVVSEALPGRQDVAFRRPRSRRSKRFNHRS
jgi:hypothetical protein